MLNTIFILSFISDMPPKKITTEQFIEKAREVNGDRYDYSLTKYTNALHKVKIICPEHGEFEQAAYSHLQGRECLKCSIKKQKFTTEQFIEKAREVHGDKFDYSLVEYLGSHYKVKIICPEHGEFEQTPCGHLKGNDCHKCGREKSYKNKRLTTEQFIERARELHGDKYDYSLVECLGHLPKVKIICPKHGEFEQSPKNHLRGHLNGSSCIKCYGNQKLTTEQFIQKARKVHGDKYDYSLTKYINRNYRVKIICPEHGEFEQVAYNHLKGNNCPYCSWYNKAKKSKYFDSFKVYFVKLYDNDGEVFYKIGTTCRNVKYRLYCMPYKHEIINVKEIKDINDKEGARMIMDLESRFKRIYKNKKYTPKKEFGGMNECFSDKIN